MSTRDPDDSAGTDAEHDDVSTPDETLGRRSGEDLPRKTIGTSGLAGHLLGRYRLLREIGHGGQGFVWLAEDTGLHRQVAVKILAHHAALSEHARLRLLREAETASKLAHPGICGVIEFGEDRGTPFIAMPYLEGETLDRKIARARAGRSDEPTISHVDLEAWDDDDDEQQESDTHSETPGRSEITSIVRFIEQAARALHAAHECGLIHRDIKPANIMATADGRAVLLDFGLARDEESENPTLTRSGDLFGTPGYMAPEQLVHGRSIDRRADVYSLGVTLFEALTLRRPFEASTRQALFHEILHREPPRVRKLNRAIPGDLQVVVEHALEKDRDRRFATALDLANDLAAVCDSRPVLARPVGPVGRLTRWAKRKPTAAALALILIIAIPLVTALGGYLWARMPDIRAQERAQLQDRVEEALGRGFYVQFFEKDDDGTAHFESALALDPTSTAAVAGLAHEHLRAGRPELALAVLDERGPSVSAPDALLVTRARVLEALGRTPDPAAAARGAALAKTSHIAAFTAGVVELSRAGETPSGLRALARAESLLAMAVASSPRPRAVYHYLLASAVGKLGPRARHPEVADAILALWPDAAVSYFHAAVARGSTDAERAVRDYRRACELTPASSASARNNIGNLLTELGRAEEAIAEIRFVLREEPENRLAHHNLGNALLVLGRFEDAAEAFGEAVRRSPSNGKAWVNLGNVLAALDRATEAEEAYARALDIDSEDTLALYNRANSRWHSGRLEEAVEDFSEAVSHDPDYAQAWCNLSSCLENLGRPLEAAAALGEALRADPDLPEAYFNRGSAAHSAKDYPRALADALQLVRLRPDDAATHYHLGIIRNDLNLSDEAVASYREAVRLKPAYPQAWCNMGMLHRRRGEHEESVRCLRRGHELGLARGASWPYDSAGWLKRSVDDLIDSLVADDELEKAVEILEDLDRAFPEIGGFAERAARISEDL